MLQERKGKATRSGAYHALEPLREREEARVLGPIPRTCCIESCKLNNSVHLHVCKDRQRWQAGMPSIHSSMGTAESPINVQLFDLFTHVPQLDLATYPTLLLIRSLGSFLLQGCACCKFFATWPQGCGPSRSCILKIGCRPTGFPAGTQ